MSARRSTTDAPTAAEVADIMERNRQQWRDRAETAERDRDRALSALREADAENVRLRGLLTDAALDVMHIQNEAAAWLKHRGNPEIAMDDINERALGCLSACGGA